MRRIPTQFELQHLLDYDPQTGSLLWRERPPSMFLNARHSAEHHAAKWNSVHAGQPASCAGANGYGYTSLGGKNVATHKVVWKLVFNTEPKEIDHINGDRTDNRISNLRCVDRSENMRNAKRPKHNTSGSLGVSFRRDRNAWRAYISVNGKHKSLGMFQTKDEATAARLAANEKYGYHANHGR